MSIITSFEKHRVAMTKFNAYTVCRLFKELVLFPYDYFLNDGQSHAPLNIALFLTLKCNARCEMCNLIELLNEKKAELSLERIDALLKEVAPYKTSITLFGGEPIIRKDFLDILERVKEYGLPCGIFTNGTLFNPMLVEKIISLEMNYVVFSVQAIGDLHDSIVKVKGAYEKMINAIKEFTKYKKRKTKVIIHTTMVEQNLDHLGKIVELGEKLNVDLVRFGYPTFFTEHDISSNKLVMNKLFPGEEIEEISYSYDPKEKAEIYFKKITEFMGKYEGRFSFTPDLKKEEIKNWYSNDFKSSRSCYFVYRGTFIYPNGDVVPCESFKFVLGNVNKKPFFEIWNSEKYIKFRKGLKKGLYPGCARCCKL